MKRARIILAILVLAAAAAGSWWYWHGRGAVSGALQGYVEGNFVYLAAEDSGRIARLTVESGDTVKAGDVIAELESSMQIAQRDEAAARLNQARATLENLKAAQQRPEQIAVLKAQEERARANLDLSRTDYERQQDLFKRGVSAKARLDQAQMTFERDKASLEEAGKQIEAARLAGRSAEIDAAEATMRAADAALKQAEVRLAKRRLVAPADAHVEDVYFRTGEVVNAGQPILALLPPGNLRFRFYVPEPALSQVTVGRAVTITCDRCTPVAATISFVSKDAEYTPPVIFSEQERAKLVFRAEARPQDGTRLPVGLPVSVRLDASEKVAAQ
jgi:HlyD family secretion protein